MATTANRFRLERTKDDSLLAQVARDVEQQIALGGLLPGDRLPSERELATQLGLSRNTVTAAYRVLEERGAIVAYPIAGRSSARRRRGKIRLTGAARYPARPTCWMSPCSKCWRKAGCRICATAFRLEPRRLVVFRDTFP